MNNFKKIFPFLIPYKKYAYLNIFFNVLYALFGTLSFVALIPMMQVLFDLAKKNTIKPIYLGWIEKGDLFENISLYFNNSKSFLEDSLQFIWYRPPLFGPREDREVFLIFNSTQ